jgi:prepilin peptidase CpaA
MNVPLWVAAPVVTLAAWAAWADVRTRKIPNALTGPALLLALLAHLIFEGPLGLRGALAGMLIAGGVMLPGWLLRLNGAGDVKLMAALGAWLAFPQALFATLAALIAGGVVAAAIALRRGQLRQVLWNTAALGAWVASPARAGGPPPGSGARFPFAVAVLAGSVGSLWIRA